jgi:hypothetical protein
MPVRRLKKHARASIRLTGRSRDRSAPAVAHNCPRRLAAPGQQVSRRAISSTGMSSQIRPQAWATMTSTATIPMAASRAVNGGAARPDGGCGRVLADMPAQGRGAGRVAGRSASSSVSSPQVRAVSACPVRSSSSSAVSLPAWKCSLRSASAASRSASEALMAAVRMFPVVAFMGLWPFCLVRVVGGFRVSLLSYAAGYRHHCRMPRATGDICHGPAPARG